MGKKDYNKVAVKNNMHVDTEEVEVPIIKKELTKVVSVEPRKMKRNLVSRLLSGVVGPEGLPGIGEYVNEEIIKPALKGLIVDGVTSAINMIMYGEKGGPSRHGYRQSSYSRGSQSYQRPATNYSSRYTSQQPEPAERRARPSRYGVEEYVIEDRNDVSHVLVTLTENADMYDNVSVADYYDLIGVASQYTDNQYGWTIDSITRATIVPVRGGYIINFPPVEVI